MNRNQRGKKRGNRFRANRMKHWFKELSRRNNKEKTMKEKGFKKTRMEPTIYWRENNIEQEAINTRSKEEWQMIVADAKRAEHRVWLRFQIMPEFESESSEHGP